MAHRGTPCWIDVTTDLTQAQAFYAQVLGWTFAPLPGVAEWVMAHAGGTPVAALGPGTPRDWLPYLRTDDIAASVSTAVEAGGQVVMSPRAVGTLGDSARIRDPGGATVGLWQPGDLPGFDASGEPGTPVWMEVNTRDSDAVRDFFVGLFGLTAEKQPKMRYYTLHAEGVPRYGVLHMNAMWDGMDPCWMVYFAVADVDASSEAVTRAGGTVEYPAFDTPFGRIAICRDPCGTPLTLMTPSQTSDAST